MNKFISFTTALLITTSMSVAADGGKRWEQMVERNSVPHLHTGTPSASKMEHTAAQHKRWLFDDAKNSELDANVSEHKHSVPKHVNHMASDHKFEMVGGN
ncbi:hypothetical protein [Alkalimarinus coralli]|uniref:hypothetical protein n=1 Tax=Alkalimarinus coralli TaxID=2935863 RepID=UPI00202B7C85|nr:hypothetical protein [Alkalimarinus coralli]